MHRAQPSHSQKTDSDILLSMQQIAWSAMYLPIETAFNGNLEARLDDVASSHIFSVIS